jgi:hypothetical protein
MQPSLFLKVLVAILCAIVSPAAWAGSMPWASADYVNLYFRIYNGNVPLPHLREEKQKALFNHLIDPENLVNIQSASMSRDDKLHQLGIIMAMLGGYRARYNYAVFVGEPLEQELAMVQAYQLQALASIAKLSPPDGPRAAWVTLIGGVIDAVGNHQTYSPRQNAIMADAIARYYPAIAPVLSNNERNLIRTAALKLDDGDDNDALRQAKDQILRAVTNK